MSLVLPADCSGEEEWTCDHLDAPQSRGAASSQERACGMDTQLVVSQPGAAWPARPQDLFSIAFKVVKLKAFLSVL